jgi:uncharacterized protein
MSRSQILILLFWGIGTLTLGCQRGRALEDHIPRAIDRRLVRAAIRGDIAEMDAAVKEGADPNASAEKGMCLLTIAYVNRNKAGFEHLLELGADPHHEDHNGMRVIHYVAGNGTDSEWIEMVLEHGGDPNISYPDGNHTYNGPNTPVFNACSSGHLDSVKTLAQHGANLDAVGERG